MLVDQRKSGIDRGKGPKASSFFSFSVILFTSDPSRMAKMKKRSSVMMPWMKLATRRARYRTVDSPAAAM